VTIGSYTAAVSLDETIGEFEGIVSVPNGCVCFSAPTLEELEVIGRETLADYEVLVSEEAAP